MLERVYKKSVKFFKNVYLCNYVFIFKLCIYYVFILKYLLNYVFMYLNCVYNYVCINYVFELCVYWMHWVQ